MSTPLRRPSARLAAPGLLAGLLGLCAAACGGADAVCSVRTERVMAVDGTAYRCTVAEDCPRPSRVFVCVTDRNSDQACVRCAQTVCERVIPEVCE